jgi:hypothetical protein
MSEEALKLHYLIKRHHFGPYEFLDEETKISMRKVNEWDIYYLGMAPELPESLKERWGTSLEKTRQYIKECGRILDEVPF